MTIARDDRHVDSARRRDEEAIGWIALQELRQEGRRDRDFGRQRRQPNAIATEEVLEPGDGIRRKHDPLLCRQQADLPRRHG
jgi:hypothetical protein